MAALEELDYCPRTPECTTKKIYRDPDSKDLYQIVKKTLTPHTCTTKGSEKPPVLAYAGVWLNTRTGRTRVLGPVRMRHTAETVGPPYDKEYWELQEVLTTKLVWRKAK